ncbi:hypothetical protein HanXRQr2_Chr14g0658981 [Helianthus annuus]|uniref:Uncharacterized protein n=1 Tax=Helianthus annuus TaxID=4232 RepID=A0A9K3H933_HELAN|nr:hypothetical protein HanXRQr2_Chr14g0658981 [Helianthus annuus]KAJ0486909.1 hypothetical protein HanHA89_Chr14g0584711 [Helianthus annuus]
MTLNARHITSFPYRTVSKHFDMFFSQFHLEKSLEGRLRTILISFEFSPRRILASHKFITVQDQSLRHSSYGESRNGETE